jgi:hypothetical protein
VAESDVAAYELDKSPARSHAELRRHPFAAGAQIHAARQERLGGIIFAMV